MKSTPELMVYCQPGLKPNEIGIHPNEGFDLGMMTTSHDVELDGNGPALVRLHNDCPRESVRLPAKLYEKLGKPKCAVLKFDGNRLYIETR